VLPGVTFRLLKVLRSTTLLTVSVDFNYPTMEFLNKFEVILLD